MSHPRSAEELADAFRGKAIATFDEARLQHWAAGVLRSASVDFEEQVPLSPRDRLDFLCGGVAIELKVKGSLADLLRQLDRYAEHERVSELLVVSTRRQLVRLPEMLREKPLFAVHVGAF